MIRIPRHSNGKPEEVRNNLRGALEIKSVSSERQPEYFNPCHEDNGGCSHLCLYLGGSKYVCECSNYYELNSCNRELKESLIKPPDNDEITLIRSSTEGTTLTSKSSDSSLILKVVVVMTILLLLVFSAIICELCVLKKKIKR